MKGKAKTRIRTDKLKKLIRERKRMEAVRIQPLIVVKKEEILSQILPVSAPFDPKARPKSLEGFLKPELLIMWIDGEMNREEQEWMDRRMGSLYH